MNYEEAIKSLQETAIVMAEIQRRQSEVQSCRPLSWMRCERGSSNTSNA